MRWIELFDLALPMALLAAGYLVGSLLERRHYASIRQRERELQGVVVSSNHFKSFVAGFRNLVGGRFRGHELLLERARREALLRLKLRARQGGSTLVIGVRFHTTKVAGSATPSVEVMAYGTALARRP